MRCLALLVVLLVADNARAQERLLELPFSSSIVRDAPRGKVVELPFGTVLVNAVWRKSELAIPVCWENPQDATTEQREFVRTAIRSTWQEVSAVTFDTPWIDCASDSVAASRGIRIQIADVRPRTEDLGRYIAGRPKGMVLNFKFEAVPLSCQKRRDFCIWAIAVHEFGHALGFAHEQNRNDAPEECKAEKQGLAGTWNVTDFDPSSIMNYCNKDWNNNGRLSPRDIVAASTVYPRDR